MSSSAPFDQGQDARASGLELSDNPYAPGFADAAREWELGYLYQADRDGLGMPGVPARPRRNECAGCANFGAVRTLRRLKPVYVCELHDRFITPGDVCREWEAEPPGGDVCTCCGRIVAP
ncbi:MAG: hypothetical protein AB1592_18885 [Pseudomonadota bacterium]